MNQTWSGTVKDTSSIVQTRKKCLRTGPVKVEYNFRLLRIYHTKFLTNSDWSNENQYQITDIGRFLLLLVYSVMYFYLANLRCHATRACFS